MDSTRVFRPYFKDLRTWKPWRSLLKAALAIEEEPGDLELMKKCTGLNHWPNEPHNEVYISSSRRSGKDTIISVLTCHMALFRDWSPFLLPGEKPHIFLISVNKAQASILKDRIEAILNLQPTFKKMIKRILADTIELKNEVVIRVMPASFRSLRGYTIVCAILSEISFWRYELDSANRDQEILTSLRPGLSTIPGSLLVAISSPFSKRGVLYEMYEKWFGNPGNTLFWKSSTLDMNPPFSLETVEAAYRDDPHSAMAEYGGEFRSDISSYVDPEIVDACVVNGQYELPYMEGNVYHGFLDAAGGKANGDSFSLAITHRDRESGDLILDLIRETVPPFRPLEVVEKYSKILKNYNIFLAKADSWASGLIVDSFRSHGVEVENIKQNKSTLYSELLPILNSNKIRLLENEKLIAQIKSLDRKVHQGGRSSIDCFYGHDDLINAVAGAAVLCAQEVGRLPPASINLNERELTDSEKLELDAKLWLLDKPSVEDDTDGFDEQEWDISSWSSSDIAAAVEDETIEDIWD